LSDNNGCPEELRDGYLVDLFEGDLREREVLKVVPDGVEYLLKAKELVDEKEMCQDVEEFKKNLDRMSNGIFANRKRLLLFRLTAIQTADLLWEHASQSIGITSYWEEVQY